MATKTFLKDILIKNKKSALSFLGALENAEGKKKKIVNLNTPVKTIKDEKTIRNIFGKEK